MNPIAASLVVGALVVGGKYARGKSPTIENGVGIAGVAIGLTLLTDINDKFGRTFSALVVLVVALAHFPVIAKKAGF